MTNIVLFYKGEKVDIEERNPDGSVHVRAQTGTPFTSDSDLRHHQGQVFQTALALYIDPKQITFAKPELQVGRGLLKE